MGSTCLMDGTRKSLARDWGGGEGVMGGREEPEELWEKGRVE